MSGNYAYSLCRALEQKGYVFEVVSTPCQIAKDGCGYCLKFPEQYMTVVLGQARESRIEVREIYRIVPLFSKNKYEKVY
jgi:hypothetical protein